MKKIISIILILIIILGALFYPNKVFANFSIDSANLYSKGLYEGYLTHNDVSIIFNYVVYSKDGKEYPAYCLNKDLDAITSNVTYSVSTEELLSNVKVWRTIINGYPYKTASELGCNTNEEAFIATKQAVYCMLYNRDLNEYKALDERQERVLNALNKILNNARNSTEIKQSSNLSIVDVTNEWEEELLDEKYVSKTYRIATNAPINTYTVMLENMKIEGSKIVNERGEQKEFKYNENFKIVIPITAMQNEGEFTIKVYGQVATKPVLYGYSANRNLQDYAITGSIYEDGEGARVDKYFKNETKIIVIKKDDNENELEGVKFNLLDENYNITHSDLTTNKNGEITIANIQPGKYYLEEVSTLNGYAKYDELIEVDISYNEESNILVTNSKEQIEIKKPIVKENKTEVVAKLPKTGM